MTNEDAIKWLENLKQDIGQLRHEDLWPYAQAIDEIIATMKEQEAVEPDVDSEGTCTCGNCGETVGYYPDGSKVPKKFCKYCPECGQEVKWNE